MRLQGMPAGIGSGLGRKRSRSVGASTHTRPHHHQPSYRHHQGGVSIERICSGVRVECSGRGGEQYPARVGLGRQRSRSAGEIMLLRHGHGQGCPGGSGGIVEGRDLRGYYQEQQEGRWADTVMGRQRSHSVGEKIRPHMHPHVHPPRSAVPETRPLALVDKYIDRRGSSSYSRYPLPGPSALPLSPPSSAHPQHRSLSQHQAYSDHHQPRPQYLPPSQSQSQSQHLPLPRSILRTRADSSSHDRLEPPSSPTPGLPFQPSKYSSSPSPHASHNASPPTTLSKPGTTTNPPSLPLSRIPVPQSQRQRHVNEPCGTLEPALLGHDETGIAASAVGMSCDNAGVHVRRIGQPPYDSKERQDRTPAPVQEASRSSSNIENSSRFPNPHSHPRADREAEDDLGLSLYSLFPASRMPTLNMRCSRVDAFG